MRRVPIASIKNLDSSLGTIASRLTELETNGGGGGGTPTPSFYQKFTATANQTSFTLTKSGLVATEIIVTVNGLKQIPTTDYTILSGTSLVFSVGLAAGDVLEVMRPSGEQGPPGEPGAPGGDPLILATEYSNTMPAPPTNGVKVFAKRLAGRGRLATVGPSGVDVSMQSLLATNKIGYWGAQGNSTTAFNNANPGLMLFNFGHNLSGTATARNVAVTNVLTASRRVGFVSSTTAGSTAGTRHGLLQFWRGNAPGLGGFEYIARFGVSQTTSTARLFVGMAGSAAAITTDARSNTNIIGCGFDLADTNFQFFYRGASGTGTKIDLGANFPSNSVSDLYEVRIFCAPNESNVYWCVQRPNTSFMAEGVITTDLPTSTTLLSPQITMGNGTNAAAVGIDVVSQYIETDF